MQKSFTLLAIMFVLFTSCRKEVTEVTQVTEVKNNAIGIRYSVKPADWKTQDGGVSFTASLTVPELDDTIYDHGAVLSYISFGTDYYEALPEVFDGIAYGAIHSPGYVSIDYSALDGSIIGAPSVNVDIKIILIPAQAVKANPGVNLKDFKAVQKAFLNK